MKLHSLFFDGYPLRTSTRLLLACTALGCALSAPLMATENDSPSDQANTSTERSFTSDSLLALLTAEIAGSRQQYDTALKLYAQQARLTRDPQVCARATLIARHLDADTVALEMSLLWVNVDPKNVTALGNASLSLMQANRLQEAFSMSRRLQNQGGEPLYQNIAASASNLSKLQRDKLLQSYRTLLPHYTHDEQILVGIGLLLQQQDNFSEAMNYAQKALTAYPLSIPAALLEANLLHELKRDREAIEKMGNLLAYYPDNISLRNQYAHILTRYDLALAQQQFAIIVKQQPQNTEAALALGLIAMERKDNKTATKIFEKLLETVELAATAHFHLGRIAERKNDQQEAIYNYLQVDSGNEFLPATINLLNIFIEKGDLISAQDHMDRLYNRHPEQSESLSLLHSQALINYNYFAEAEKLLSAAINSSSRPNNFLYARAMLFNQRNQPSATERDLRQILLTEPENAIALNSLGYLLSENTARLSEAEELLTKAITLRPNDPVIIDSLGWLHFRQGKFTDALRELRQAYASYQEPAAAAHLGEVLWVTGSQEEARQIWLEGIKLAPTDNTIKSTMKRLKAEQ